MSSRWQSSMGITGQQNGHILFTPHITGQQNGHIVFTPHITGQQHIHNLSTLHTHICMHNLSHTQTHSHIHALSLSHTHTHSLSHRHTLSLSHTHTTCTRWQRQVDRNGWVIWQATETKNLGRPSSYLCTVCGSSLEQTGPEERQGQVSVQCRPQAGKAQSSLNLHEFYGTECWHYNHMT